MFEFAVAPFALFSLVATGTPGPNNMINLSQGVRIGFWRALPFAIGTGFGVASLLIAVAFGLGAAFQALPTLHVVMKAVTALFILYLAWRIAASGPLSAEAEAPRLGFLSGVAFQWINPKTWTVSVSMATTFFPPEPPFAAMLVAGAIFCVISWTTQPFWIGFGAALRRFLSDPKRARIFNIAMAALLLVSTLPVLLLAG